MTVDGRKNSITGKQVTYHSPSNSAAKSQYYKCFQNYHFGQRYLNPNPVFITDLKPTVIHWQLRDLIHVCQQTGNVFMTRNDSIRKLNLTNLHSTQHLKLDFVPRCYNIADNGIIVSGGLISTSSSSSIKDMECLQPGRELSSRSASGLFSFFNPQTSFEKTVRVGEMINNSVSISKRGELHFKAHICNNDSNLYVLDINNNGTFKIDKLINCEENTSLNNAVSCPIYELLLTVVGDSSSIFMVDTRSPEDYVKKIRSKYYSGFGISYHPNGTMFATNFEDGSCLLYDIRYLSDEQPLLEIKSTRQGHQSGAFRSCKFSQNPMHNLLAVLEQVGRVHMVDVRQINETTSEDHQVIVFPFALNQYGQHKAKEMSNNSVICESYDEETAKEVHSAVSIYDRDNSTSSESLEFSAPLVYDNTYLTKTKPQLFRNYVYSPSSKSSDYGSVENMENVPLLSAIADPLQGPEASYSHWNSPDRRNRSIYHDTYLQQAMNHTHGEMALAGLDWYENNLLIGCEEGGLLGWKINDMERRSFGSFAHA